MARREAGQGTIRQRADRRWEGRVFAGYHQVRDGTRKRQFKYFYGATQREVQEQLTEALRNRDQGLPVTTGRVTVSSYLVSWLSDRRKAVDLGALGPGTFRGYNDMVRLHIAPEIGRKSLTRLSPQDISAMMASLAAKGLGPRSVAYSRAVLRVALNQAMTWGLVARNVAALARPPRQQRREIKPWSLDQARRFLKAVTGNHEETLYRVALALGLHQGEVLGLRWQDVELDTRELRVRVQLQRNRLTGILELVQPKSDWSRRTLPLPMSLVKALRAHYRRQLEDQLAAGPHWQGERWGLAFLTPIGTPLDGRAVTRRFQAILERAGLPRQRFHDLRHACASFLLAQGVPARTVMDWLGHSQIAITMDLYSHVIPELKRDAADRMDAVLAGG